MKALTVKQPYAHAIDLCYKTIEIRSWPTNYRGPVLITSSMRPRVEMQGIQLPTGTMICVVEITDCKPMTKRDARNAMVDYHKDHISWHLQFKYTVEKIPIRGKLGLWTPDQRLIVRAPSNPNRKRGK